MKKIGVLGLMAALAVTGAVAFLPKGVMAAEDSDQTISQGVYIGDVDVSGMTQEEAKKAVEDGIKKAIPTAEVMIRPVADGGEGTVTALTTGLQGSLEKVAVTGPLGQKVEAAYGILPDKTAVIEMAEAAGLPLVPVDKRNPMETTTYGVGELISHAMDRGCRKFIVGIGGREVGRASCRGRV